MKKKVESINLDKFRDVKVEEVNSIKGGSYGGGPTMRHDPTEGGQKTADPSDDHYTCDHTSDRSWF